MKKILLIIATLAFFLVSCDIGDMKNEMGKPNPLIGIWEDSNDNYIERFQFTDSEIIATYQNIAMGDTEPVVFKGTYQYYDTVIIFRMESGLKYFADCSISGSELTLAFSHNGNTAKYQRK